MTLYVKMTTLNDIIFISLQDGYYNISLYYPNKNSNAVNIIKSGEPFTYGYDGVTFKMFENYSNKNYAITDVYAFEQQMNNFPPYLYKFDYEELAYLAVRELFKISLKKYRECILDERKMPLFKIVFSDCYKAINHKNKSLYQYFRDAIAQNGTFFKINANDLTVDFASNVYPYHLYEKTIYNGIDAPQQLKTEFEHCIFDVGYTTITCYIYRFKTQVMEENLANLIKSKKRSVIVSHELKDVSVIPSGIFSFISSVYYKLIEKDKFKMIHSNSSYDYFCGVQNLIPESTAHCLSSFNQTSYVNFKDSNDDNHGIHQEDIFTTSIMSSVVEQISNIIRSFNIESYHINSIISFEWFFDQFLYLKFFKTNGYTELLINSLFYRYAIINNLLYGVVNLPILRKELESILNGDDIIYEREDKRFCRKRTSIFPKLRIDTKTHEFKLIPIEDIDGYIQLGKYVDELNVKDQKNLDIKNKFSINVKPKLTEIYGAKKVNGVYNKLIMLSMYEPTLLQQYLNDFAENPETYL